MRKEIKVFQKQRSNRILGREVISSTPPPNPAQTEALSISERNPGLRRSDNLNARPPLSVKIALFCTCILCNPYNTPT